MPPNATNNGNISGVIHLSALAIGSAGFSTVLLLVPLATNSLNGDRVVTFATLAEAQDYQTAGYISAATLVALTTAFSQDPTPAEVKVGYVDLVGAETYATALTACIAVDSDFYGVCIFVRTNAEIAAVGALVETNAKRMLFGFQSADSSWLNSGIPSGLSAMADYERSFAMYHDTATEWADLAQMVKRLGFDPDLQSAPWNAGGLADVDAYATAITSTQRGYVIANNGNVVLPFGLEDASPDPGVNLAGRPLYELVTADWFMTRLQEDTSALINDLSNRGAKLPLDATGQTMVVSAIKSRLAQGVAAGHFEDGQYTVVAEAITSADITARRMRVTVRAQNVVSARLFTFNLYFSTTPVVA